MSVAMPLSFSLFQHNSMASWAQVALVVDRYETIAKNEIQSLKRLHQQIIEGERKAENTSGLRNQAKKVENQLLSGLAQVLMIRDDLDNSVQAEFDVRIEPVRKLIQTTVNVINQLPKPSNTRPFNPFDDDAEEQPNIYDEEARIYSQAQSMRHAELKLKAEEAKVVAEESQRLERDINDLNEIFTQLQSIVHQQHDMVDSIEEHVEQAVHDVQRGNQQLKQAVKSKNAKVPLVAAVAGGVALGGPVGIAAGSTIAGVAAAVTGVFAGLYGGRYIKKTNIDDSQ